MDPAEELTLPPLRARSRLPQRALLAGAGLLVVGGGTALALGGLGGGGGLLSWMRGGEGQAVAVAPATGRAPQAASGPDTGRAAGPESAPATGRADGPETVPATGRVDAPQAAPATGRVDEPEAAPATGRVDEPEAAPETGRVDEPESAPETGRSDGPETAPATGRSDGPETAPSTGRADAPESAAATGRVDEPESEPATGRADAIETAPETGRTDAPESSTATGRSEDALPYPTGRREGLPPDQVVRVRPDGSEVLLRRIPAGPVRVDGARIHEPAFWIEQAPASLSAYARFLRATRQAGDPLEPLYPEGEPGALLRAHVERDEPLPVGAVSGLSPAAAEAFLRWSGLTPLSARQRQRAAQWGQVPGDDLRGGLPETREGR